MMIIRSLMPASDLDVSESLTDLTDASNVRTISLSSAIVADMYIRRGASKKVGRAFTRGNTGVIVKSERLMSAWHRCRLSRKKGQTSSYAEVSALSSSRTASNFSLHAQYGTSSTPKSEPS